MIHDGSTVSKKQNTWQFIDNHPLTVYKLWQDKPIHGIAHWGQCLAKDSARTQTQTSGNSYNPPRNWVQNWPTSTSNALWLYLSGEEKRIPFHGDQFLISSINNAMQLQLNEVQAAAELPKIASPLKTAKAAAFVIHVHCKVTRRALLFKHKQLSGFIWSIQVIVTGSISWLPTREHCYSM